MGIPLMATASVLAHAKLGATTVEYVAVTTNAIPE